MTQFTLCMLALVRIGLNVQYKLLIQCIRCQLWACDDDSYWWYTNFPKAGSHLKSFSILSTHNYWVPPYKRQSLQQLDGGEFCTPALYSGMWSYCYVSIVMPNSHFRDGHVPINSWSNIFHRVSFAASQW